MEERYEEINENKNNNTAKDVENEGEINELKEQADQQPMKNHKTKNSKDKIKKKNKVLVDKNQKMQSKRPQLKWGNWNLSPQFLDYEIIVYDVGERESWSPIDHFSNYYGDEFFVQLASETNIHYLQ